VTSFLLHWEKKIKLWPSKCVARFAGNVICGGCSGEVGGTHDSLSVYSSLPPLIDSPFGVQITELNNQGTAFAFIGSDKVACTRIVEWKCMDNNSVEILGEAGLLMWEDWRQGP